MINLKPLIKSAGMMGNTLMSGMTLMGLKSDMAEQDQRSQQMPMVDQNQFTLQSPYSYQFNGGKNLPTKPTIGVNSPYAEF